MKNNNSICDAFDCDHLNCAAKKAGIDKNLPSEVKFLSRLTDTWPREVVDGCTDITIKQGNMGSWLGTEDEYECLVGDEFLNILNEEFIKMGFNSSIEQVVRACELYKVGSQRCIGHEQSNE